MIEQWVKDCTWFFNSYCFSSYTLMIIIRRYQAATLDDIEDNPKYQIVMMGVFMPVFVIHTILGGEQFFNAPLMECRKQYKGEVFYIIVFMFAVSMCVVFILLLLCILLPTWIRKFKRRRRTRQLAGRIQGMDGMIDANPLLNNEER